MNQSREQAFKTVEKVVIIGGGPGGYEAAITAAQLGSDVTLITNEGIGGSAVLTDVVPSKTLIATAEFATNLQSANQLGVQLCVPNSITSEPVTPEIIINLSAINQRLLKLAEDTSNDMRIELEELGVKVVAGYGKIIDEHTVSITSTSGTENENSITADIIIIATGAKPRTLDSAYPDGEKIFTWKQLYNLDKIPENLIVIGSGVTGAEFANAYNALGSNVTLISSRDQVLPGEDEDAAKLIQDLFLSRHMNLINNAKAETVKTTPEGVNVYLADGTIIKGTHCLIAVGSIPNTVNIGLENINLETNEQGKIQVNRVGRTSSPNIYAVGDCSTAPPLASVAIMQGRTAIFHALGDGVKPLNERNIASNIFTQPEIASVGWGQKDIENGTIRGEVNLLPLYANPRAKMQGIQEGFIKLISTTTSGTVIGGVIVAPKASELIFSLALAIEHRLTVDDVASAYSIYPSLSTTIVDAARALHIRKPHEG